jgi:hypothetical protein
MSSHVILIDTPIAAPSFEGTIRPLTGKREMVNALARYFNEIAAGNELAKLRMEFSGVVATNAVTLASFVAADTVTLNGVVFTGRASNPAANEFVVGTNEVGSNNLRTALLASTSAKVVSMIRAYKVGTVTLSSFVNNDTVTINGIVFTGKTTPAAATREQFAIGSTDTKTGINLANAILNSLHPNLAGLISASPSAGVVTLTFESSSTLAISAHGSVANAIVRIDLTMPGAIGNLATLAISAHGSVTGANFASGADGNFYGYLSI